MNSTVSETTSYHLRIRRSAWEPMLRRLSVHDDIYAVGTIRRLGALGELLLLVDELQIPAEIPNGQQRPPLEDWFVIVMPSRGEAGIDQILCDLQPRPTQLLVVLLLNRSLPERCRLVKVEHGKITPVDSCEIVGLGMLKLQGSPPGIEHLDVRRSSRTRGALGEALHDRLRGSTVTVVGLGRNGSQMCFLLAGLGIGRLRLIDGDILQPENLDGMPGLTANDVGLSKAESLAVRLAAFRPDLSITYIEQPVTSRDASALLHRPCDLLVSTVDNDAARLAVSLLANEILTPHLDVGTLVRRDDSGCSLYADIRLLLPGMCVACVGGLADPEAAFYELSAPDGSLHRGQPLAWSDQRSGSLVHLNSMACSFGVELWLRLLRGEIGAYWQRVTWEANQGIHLTGTEVAGSAACRLCQPSTKSES